MASHRRTSSVLHRDAHHEPTDGAETSAQDDALALAEVAEAEAAEAEAVAAAARARARDLRRGTRAAAAAAGDTSNSPASAKATVAEPAEETKATALDEPTDADNADNESGERVGEVTDETVDEPARRRRLRLPRLRLKVVAASLVVPLTIGLLAATGWMVRHHRGVVAEQQRSAEFAAAARQGIATLMSLNFNHAQDDVKRIIDSTTGDFRKGFEQQAADFTKAAQDSKVVTEATVNATAVQSMTQDSATVLMAVTTRGSNVASREQQPRSWRLSVDVVRDSGQIKLAKVEFVP